ncbi:BglG family transcription antiterminator [Clostridium nigeriense]|uniref:BglG family transcription antiterminator n=1 Tax=Clostridium nigeriense TaxID=1805470 RepID=UPI003D34D627
MDKEIVSILQILLNNTLITADRLQEESNSSKRQINYRIDKINDMLKSKNVPLIYLKTDKDTVVRKETKNAIKEILENNYSKNTYYFSKSERLLYMYLMLFINLGDISINHFIDSLKVSRSTVNLDFKDLIPYLSEKGIEVKNNRINGYYLNGSEIEIRRVLIKKIIETLANENSSRVLDIFIEEYKLEQFEEAKKVILKLVEKYQITFVEDRLTEFIYIFIFIKARMHSDDLNNSECEDIPNVKAMSSMKEYMFSKELLEVYDNKENIKSYNVMYISAWILGISVGNYEEDTEDRAAISEIVNKIMKKFGYLSGVYYVSQEKIFKQIYAHFRPAYYRLLFKLPVYNPICEKVKEEYRLVYKIVSNAMKDFGDLFGEEIQDEEISYLTMHFATIFSNKKNFYDFKKRVAVIACSNGVGSSAILYKELTNLFSDLHFLPPMELSEVKKLNKDIDIIFTTNYNSEGLEIDVPVIKVSPVMTAKEKYNITREVYIQLGDIFLRQPKIDEVIGIIKKYAKITSESMLSSELLAYFTQIENFKSNEGDGPMLSEITNERLIKLKVKAKDWEDAIRQSASALVEDNKVTKEYVDAMVNTAKESGPYIVITKHVALPHARPEAGAKDISIGIATLENPVEFGNDENDPVKYVFCLSAIDNSSHLRAMSELVELLENEEFFRVLDNAKDPKEIINFIKKYEV